jgi:hypothetical protein
VYAIAPAGRITPGMLRAVAGVFSNGAPELLVARAFSAAVRDELRRAMRRIGAFRRVSP